MTYLLAMLAGVVLAAGGFFAGLGLGSLLAPALGISGFEGAAGYFAVSVGLLGGVGGLALGIALALRFKGGHKSFGAIAGRGAVVVLALAALGAGAILVRLATVETFQGANPQLHFEIRLPAGAPAPDRKSIDVEMQAGSQRSGGLLKDEWLRSDGGRPVLSGFVPLYTRTARRTLVVTLPGQPALVFQIRLAATPKVSESFGGWQRVDFVDERKPDAQPRRPNASEGYDIRVRVPDWTKP